MGNAKLSTAYWRRQAKGWYRVAENYKRMYNAECGLRGCEQTEVETRMDWLKQKHPDVYFEMLKDLPDEIDNNIDQLELFDS